VSPPRAHRQIAPRRCSLGERRDFPHEVSRGTKWCPTLRLTQPQTSLPSRDADSCRQRLNTVPDHRSKTDPLLRSTERLDRWLICAVTSFPRH
jgi:hypothetical protein